MVHRFAVYLCNIVVYCILILQCANGARFQNAFYIDKQGFVFIKYNILHRGLSVLQIFRQTHLFLARLI